MLDFIIEPPVGLNEDAIDDLDIDCFFPVADSFEHGRKAQVAGATEDAVC